MGDDEGDASQKLRIASRLFACSEGNIKLCDAMKVAEYETPERKGGTVYQRIDCNALMLWNKIDSDIKSIPLSVMFPISEASINNLSLLSSASSSRLTLAYYYNTSSRRSLTRELIGTTVLKRKRWRSKDKHQADAVKLHNRIRLNYVIGLWFFWLFCHVLSSLYCRWHLFSNTLSCLYGFWMYAL